MKPRRGCQALAVDGHRVVEAEDALDEVVLGRLVTDLRNVHAHAGGQGQVVVDRPGVLDEERQVVVAEVGGDALERLARQRTSGGVAPVAPVAEVIEAGEVVGAEQVAAEQVEDVVLSPLKPNFRVWSSNY